MIPPVCPPSVCLKIPANVKVVYTKARPVVLLNGSGTEYKFDPMGTPLVSITRITGRRKERWTLPTDEARALYRHLLQNGFYRW